MQPASLPGLAHQGVRLSKRARAAQRDQRLPFVPPETWHEPRDEADGYRVVVQPAGAGFRHVVTPDEVRERLAELPTEWIEPLEVVQLSRMTRKKQSFPCYGLQWGTSIYLYPLEEDLVEHYREPPRPSQLIEARQFGGRWVEQPRGRWQLIWTEQAVKDFYLHNILIHELGHLLDDRNSRSADRERFAEHFALRHGFRTLLQRRMAARDVVRRHHRK
jgi:hypothetical protein